MNALAAAPRYIVLSSSTTHLCGIYTILLTESSCLCKSKKSNMSYLRFSPYDTQPDLGCALGMKESPDILLTKFIQSTEIIHLGRGQPPPQKLLTEIMNDERWTRRMLEDWFNKGPPSKTIALTPDPEFRAIYLMLLSILEETGREKSGLGVLPQEQKFLTYEEEKEEEKKLQERIEKWNVEHKKWKVEHGIEPAEPSSAKEVKDEEQTWELV